MPGSPLSSTTCPRLLVAWSQRAWRSATTHLPHGEITYTCVPPGSGLRIGLDRDEDGILDGDDHNTRRGATTR